MKLKHNKKNYQTPFISKTRMVTAFSDKRNSRKFYLEHVGLFQTHWAGPPSNQHWSS